MIHYRNVSPVAPASYASSSGNPFGEDKDFDEEDSHNPFGTASTTPDGASAAATTNQRSPYQPSNPFGDPDEEAKSAQDVTSNPFGEPADEDEYDEAKNPFAE